MQSADDTILVTGGAGFIGSNFVRHVLARSALRVVVLDKLTYAGNRETLADVDRTERVHLEVGDIVDGAFVRRIIRETKPKYLVNFAAESHVDRSIDGPRAFVETNIVGTFELLEASRAARDLLPKEFRFLHVSTDEVYGSLGAEGAFSESTPYAPNSPYAATKASADHLVRSYSETFGLPVVTTNCSNNYGPYQYPEKLIPLVTMNALSGQTLPIYGKGDNVRDWLHVEDHCSGIWAALIQGRLGDKYNIGGFGERRNLDVVDALCAALEKVAPAKQNEALRIRGAKNYTDLKAFVADRPGHDQRYAIDSSKIQGELGWRAERTFEEGIASTVSWYLENRVWCDTVSQNKYRRERLGLGTEAR